MKYLEAFHLHMLSKRFADIMSGQAEVRKQRLKMLLEDVETVFELPQSRVHPEVINFYQTVKEASLIV